MFWLDSFTFLLLPLFCAKLRLEHFLKHISEHKILTHLRLQCRHFQPFLGASLFEECDRFRVLKKMLRTPSADASQVVLQLVEVHVL